MRWSVFLVSPNSSWNFIWIQIHSILYNLPILHLHCLVEGQGVCVIVHQYFHYRIVVARDPLCTQRHMNAHRLRIQRSWVGHAQFRWRFSFRDINGIITDCMYPSRWVVSGLAFAVIGRRRCAVCFKILTLANIMTWVPTIDVLELSGFC